MWQRLDDLDKVGWEEAMNSAHLPVVPVLIHLPAQDDNVTLAELEVSWFLAIIVVECLGTRELGYTLQTEIESKTHIAFQPAIFAKTRTYCSG